MNTFKIWAYSIVTVIVLGLIVYIVHISNKVINTVVNGVATPITILLTVLIDCLIVLVIAGTLFIIAYGVSYVWKYHTTTEVSEIGTHGTVLVTRGKYQVVTPYVPTTISEVKQKAVKEIEEKKIIPTMSELLRTGYISGLISNATMLLGFNQDTFVERIGTIEDNRTTGIAGKSRSGKTVTMFFLILQYVLAGAKISLVDKAWSKSSSLYNLLLPLIEAGYVAIARTPMEVTSMTDDFIAMLDARENNTASMEQTNIIVFDEWTSFMHDKLMMKKLVPIAQRISNESAGYNAYMLVGGQSWSASQAGGNAFINSLHSFFVHKIDYFESKRMLERKYATLTEKLTTGKNFFKDTSGEIEKLTTPLCTVADSYIVIAILEGIQARNTRISQPTSRNSQLQFNNYVPKQLNTRREEIEDTSLPVTPNVDDTDKVFSSKQRSQKLIPDLVSEDKAIRVTPVEQKAIQDAIEQAKLDGKVKANGKVVRTYVRDVLSYDARQYKKIEVYCNANNY